MSRQGDWGTEYAYSDVEQFRPTCDASWGADGQDTDNSDQVDR